MAADSENEGPKLTIQTNVKEGEKWERTVNVTIAAPDVNKEWNHVIGGVSGMVNLPGFRAGKVPRDIVEKRFGGDIKKQVTQNLLEKSITTAIEQEKLKVVGEPSLDVEKIKIEKNTPVEFSFSVEVFPQFELPVYTGLAIEQEEIDVLPEEYAEAYKNVSERYSEEVVAAPDHALAEKDNAGGVLRVLVDGNEVHKEEDARLLLVDGHVFGAYSHLGDKFLLGAKVGDKRTAEEVLAENFPIEAHRGKKATIEFEVKSVKSLVVPEMNAELAQKMGFDTLDALKEKVRTTLLEKIGSTIKERTQDNLLKQITSGTNFELPVRALARSAARNLESQVQQFSRMGYSFEQLGMDPEQFVLNSKVNSETELRRFFVLETLCAKENITVGDEEVDDFLVGMARQQGTTGQALYDKMAEEGQLPQIEASLRMKKAMEFLVDSAEIKVVPRKPFKTDDGAGHSHGEHSHGGVACDADHGGHEHGGVACDADHGGHEHGGHEHGGVPCDADHGAEAAAPGHGAHEHGH